MHEEWEKSAKNDNESIQTTDKLRSQEIWRFRCGVHDDSDTD